ncbi:DUF2516 domain-containing protein [Corynebacterium jeikeium]|jgi:hypothetical protein|uniref:Putative membrane protein n=1 Tax=Corynebacterium jeikeium (strain K411) TaxID=306537 RepID=Q4JSV2_CORJK|nr:DUF2516 family protein [Corynebacterium jeikeium]EEW15787.1 hypothetical protein HMPREF0297_1824 [Corynebacterium jeikeium ATCC 43734]OOD32818.1 hypothetical protein BWP03_03545 [Corynebacterium jeikeium]WCZ54582.1 hypothetical protein CJEIK_10460 [Corynebacterium jeikeium]CAI38105.1 putative membrane protein [Corynebacterium jeikeium K411]SCX24062.1 hypothetical protein CJBVI_1862 [Corynebacterium jeikeium]
MYMVFTTLANVYMGINLALAVAIFVLAAVGLAQLASTRDDAFMVIDREKQNWLMLMGGAVALSILSFFIAIELLWIIAAVIVGIYWQDVRPAIRDVLDNAGGSW